MIVGGMIVVISALFADSTIASMAVALLGRATREGVIRMSVGDIARSVNIQKSSVLIRVGFVDDIFLSSLIDDLVSERGWVNMNVVDRPETS